MSLPILIVVVHFSDFFHMDLTSFYRAQKMTCTFLWGVSGRTAAKEYQLAVLTCRSGSDKARNWRGAKAESLDGT